MKAWSGASSSNRTDLNLAVNAPLSLTAVWHEEAPVAPPAQPGASPTTPAGSPLPFVLVAVLAAAVAGIAVVARMRRARAVPAERGSPTEDSPEMAPLVAPAVLAPPASAVAEPEPCPQCGQGVVEGAPHCLNCGLDLVWS
jgi:multisubunit Na+/H+ antiporter MnhC subunit